MRKSYRAVNGILLLDKPLDLSSNQAMQRVRHLFQAQKAGHTGSLDPLASGILPICFGEATKFSQFLLDADKVYFTQGRLGKTTATGDAEGEVLQTRPVPQLDQAGLAAVLAEFEGEINQVPPMYSALKHQGRPLYELARQGVAIERPARQVTIFKLDLLGFHDDLIELRVHCSKGTYIRTLVEDIGEALGCGAFVQQLRREQAGPFALANALTLQQVMDLAEQAQAAGDWGILDRYLLPMDAGLQDWPEIVLDEAQSLSILRGQKVRILANFLPGKFRIRDFHGNFVGIGELQGEELQPQRLINTAAMQ